MGFVNRHSHNWGTILYKVMPQFPDVSLYFETRLYPTIIKHGNGKSTMGMCFAMFDHWRVTLGQYWGKTM